MLGFVFGVVACKVVPTSDEVQTSTKRGTGDLCAVDDDCTSHICRSEGFCGKAGCKKHEDCPADWRCETSDGDPIFGLGRGNTSCQPTCSSCPKDTSCEAGANLSCRPIEPRITLAGDAPRVGQPTNIELVVDTRGRTFSETTWKFEGAGALPTPSASGTGTKLAVTFHELGIHPLTVTFTGPSMKPTIVKVPIAVCGAAGSTCAGGDGVCCGGECALERGGTGWDDRRKTCVERCPATCAPGWSCREFNRVQNSSAPSGAFCLPDLPQITVDYTPKTPTINEPITFTATATSPGGLEIRSYVWRLGDSMLDEEHGQTWVHELRTSGTHHIKMIVQDDAIQVAETEITVTACIPATQGCGLGVGTTCCAGSTCLGSVCQ
jgi:hypothetical protein